ncbi:hypothetical protein FOL47_004482, partial [Perkinsus chesapeaki]
ATASVGAPTQPSMAVPGPSLASATASDFPPHVMSSADTGYSGPNWNTPLTGAPVVGGAALSWSPSPQWSSSPTAVSKLLKEARKEAREEISATRFGIFAGPPSTDSSGLPAGGGATSSENAHSTARGHLAAYDRLLRHAGISAGSPTSYFVLFYSLGESVRNRIECEEPLDAVLLSVPLDKVLLHYQHLYQRLRQALLECFSDVTEVTNLRKLWNDLRMRPGQSFLAYMSILDNLRLQLNLCGVVLS